MGTHDLHERLKENKKQSYEAATAEYAVSTLSIFVGLSLIMAGVVQIKIGFQMPKVSKMVNEVICVRPAAVPQAIGFAV